VIYDRISFGKRFSDWFASLFTLARASTAVPLEHSNAAEENIDADFGAWCRGDPMVLGNPANRYAEDSPGFMTRSGYGSLEVGASNDQ
jgi:hypothetical protein